MPAVHAVEPVLAGRRAFDEAAVGHVVLLPCPEAVLAGLPIDQEMLRIILCNRNRGGPVGPLFPKGSKYVDLNNLRCGTHITPSHLSFNKGRT